jgi:nicotinamidase-related amidase
MSNKVLVVIDIQKEYITEGRPFFIKSIRPSLENAKKVLNYAREKKWRIIHARHLQEGNIFSKENEYSDYIPGFEPKDNELEALKNNFSCYSSLEFVKIMEQYKSDEIVIIGYGSTMCCLATIIDGYHRGYNMVFVSDASLAKSTLHFDEQSTHAYATDIISTFAKVISTKKLFT